jgi:branched-chain amino acid transport system permease protein
MTSTLARYRPFFVTALVIALVLAFALQQYAPTVTANIVLSGLTLGALYFLVTSGLSLIFGLMDVLNFAHGLFFMLGAYLGYTMYANPRMILNTLPFLLALLGAVAVGVWLASLLAAGSRSSKVGGRRIERGMVAVLGVLGAGVTVWALWGFDLLKLAANDATASGGAVPTDLAQEPSDRFVIRLLLLVVAGLLLGLALGRNGAAEGRSRRTKDGRGGANLVGLVGGVVAVALAFLLVGVRAPGETFLLGLSSDLRFVLALVVGTGGGAAVGALVETSMIRPLYARPIYQVLLTLGLVFVGTEAIKGVWGPVGFFMSSPAFFSTRGKGCPAPDVITWLGSHCASINVLGRPYPSYPIFIIALGIVMFIIVLLLLQRTRLGMIIRAGVQDRDMVQALGINVRRVFTLVFALGCGLAALGGVAAAPFLGVNLGLAQDFLLLAFVAVVIGGMGSYTGAAIGALLVGLARAFGDQLVLSGITLPGMASALTFSPSIARASTVLLMAIVLLIRPAGLFGRKE